MPEKQPSRVEVSSRHRLLDNFFRIDEVAVSHEQFDGEMSPERKVIVSDRGDAVAALLYDAGRRKVIAVKQFRLPAYGKDDGGGWLVEAVAGMIHTSADGAYEETPLQCLIREVKEETGYEIAQATPICTFFPSPGGSTELIHLYYAEVRPADQTSGGGGVKNEGEDIQITEFGIEDFLSKLIAGEFKDPKLIIAGHWFMASRNFKFFAALDEVACLRRDERAEFDPNVSRTIAYKVKKGEGRILGIKTGDIKAVRGVDVWVNSENTDMMMDRFFGKSVSAAIRYLGAEKDEKGVAIKRDTIGLALQAALGERNYVQPGFVIPAPPGELAKPPYNLKRIFHVASIAGRIGEGLTTSLETVSLAIDNVLAAIDAKRYKSALVPLLATGQGSFPVHESSSDPCGASAHIFRRSPESQSEGDLLSRLYQYGQNLLEKLLQERIGGDAPQLMGP